MKEKQLEKMLLHEVNQLGGLCLKFTSPGNVGVPDRLILLNGYACFVELKSKGKKPRKIQEYQMEQISNQKIDVFVINTEHGMAMLLARLEMMKES